MAAQATGLSPFETAFARAWDTPGHTRCRLPDTDVNLVLAARYATGEPLTFTRGMLWDMETRKAARPGTYIPFVVRAGSGQPLFHVEHSVGGTELQPLNRWRIVHLTDALDERLIEGFERMARNPWLAEHAEIYIRDNLGIEL